MPALYRVQEASVASDTLTLTPSVFAGYTESVLAGVDSHRRAGAAGGIAYGTAGGFGVEARLDARFDSHEVRGVSDSGAVMDPRVVLRYVRKTSDRVALLGQIGVWVPGEKAPKPSLPATTVDALLALSMLASARLQVSVNAGYRVDRSARSIDHPERLSEADWLSLGLSDFDALLAGCGARLQLDEANLFAEARWDLLVGSGAPAATNSPMHAALGGSIQLGSPRTRATWTVDALLSSRPAVAVTGPLVPFDPRLSVIVGFSHDISFAEPQKKPEVPPPAPPVEPEAAPEPQPVEPVQALPRGVIRVVVRDTERGEPLTADVRVQGGDENLSMTGQTTSGVLELEVPPGSFEVEISAPQHAGQKRRVRVDEQGVTVINIDLRPKRAR